MFLLSAAGSKPDHMGLIRPAPCGPPFGHLRPSAYPLYEQILMRVEIIVGMKRGPLFGSVIIVGAGEVLA